MATRPLARTVQAVALSAALLLASSACAGTQTARSPFEEGGGGDRATIIVDNTNSGVSEMTVYLEEEYGRRTRLGSVSLSERKSFVVRDQPWGSRFRIRADPLSGRDRGTRVFRLTPGMSITWNVNDNNLFVRGGAP